MLKYPLALAALCAAAAAPATVTINFSGSADGRSVTGTLAYDEAQAPSTVNSGSGFQTASYFPSGPGFAFSFVSGSLSGSNAYRAAVFDATPGSGLGDQFGAFVVTGGGGNTQYSFEIAYPNATTLNSIALPFLLPQGPANFRYSFAGSGFTIPVTFTAQAGVVPEPGSWALLIVGFALTGTALRHRRPIRRDRRVSI